MAYTAYCLRLKRKNTTVEKAHPYVIDISRHIEYLLLEHDSVCVPQLGTFYVQQSESIWVEDEELFLPPLRKVSFSPDCAQGADTFISSLASSLRVTEEQAQAMCAEFVYDIRQELSDNSVAEVGSIGMFVRDSSIGADCFVPCQAGVASPELYGLDSVYMPRLSESVRQTAERVAEKAVAQRSTTGNDDKHLTIRIRRSLLYYTSAVAAAIILFLSFSSPALYTSPIDGSPMIANLFLPANLVPSAEVEEDTVTQYQSPSVSDKIVSQSEQEKAKKNVSTENISEQSSVSQHISRPAECSERQLAKSSTSVEEVKHQDKTALEKQYTESPKENTVQTETIGKAPGKDAPELTQTEFAVVLASAVSRKNAQTYVENLKQRGYKAEMRAKGSMTRVLIPGFRSQEEASKYAQQLRTKDQEFEGVWVLKI